MSENHAPVAVSPAGQTSNGATVVALHGEIDLLTATPLAERLDALTAHPNPDLVLDLRSVTSPPRPVRPRCAAYWSMSRSAGS